MKFVYFQDSSRFTRFFMTDLFTDELIQVPESVFDECVIKYRKICYCEGIKCQIKKKY